jgi:hypothetical protein
MNQTWKPETCSLVFRALQQFFGWMVREEESDHSPWTACGRPAFRSNLSPSSLMSSCGRSLRPLTAKTSSTGGTRRSSGCRRAEIAGLTTADVFLGTQIGRTSCHIGPRLWLTHKENIAVPAFLVGLTDRTVWRFQTGRTSGRRWRPSSGPLAKLPSTRSGVALLALLHSQLVAGHPPMIRDMRQPRLGRGVRRRPEARRVRRPRSRTAARPAWRCGGGRTPPASLAPPATGDPGTTAG